MVRVQLMLSSGFVTWVKIENANPSRLWDRHLPASSLALSTYPYLNLSTNYKIATNHMIDERCNIKKQGRSL